MPLAAGNAAILSAFEAARLFQVGSAKRALGGGPAHAASRAVRARAQLSIPGRARCRFRSHNRARMTLRSGNNQARMN